MQFAAQKIGWGVPAVFEAAVHSLFRSAAILAVPGHGLVTLVPAKAGGLPGALTIGVPAGFDFAKAFDPEWRAAVRGGVLRFSGGVASVDLRTAVPWRSRLAALQLDLNKPAQRRAWERASRILSADRRSDAFVRIARRPLRALLDATSAFDAARAKRAMAELVGLGAGGTPAGDDFLVGFLVALRATAGWAEETRGDFLAALCRQTKALLSKTNDVSRVYLAAAAEGEVSERLTGLAAAIAAGSGASTVGDAAGAAIVVGHTSGADGTLGLLLGAAAWGPEALARSAVSLIEELPAEV
ncbi:MAG: DUF2877 domain-containing protein [Propylenella sp.]